MCADHVVSALKAYLKQAHNVISLPSPAARGGLAPWQLRRAKEMPWSRRLDEPISPLAELARACKLSPSHFSARLPPDDGPAAAPLADGAADRESKADARRHDTVSWQRSLSGAALPTKAISRGCSSSWSNPAWLMAPSLARRPGRGVISVRRWRRKRRCVPKDCCAESVKTRFVHSRMPHGCALRLSPVPDDLAAASFYHVCHPCEWRFCRVIGVGRSSDMTNIVHREFAERKAAAGAEQRLLRARRNLERRGTGDS